MHKLFKTWRDLEEEWYSEHLDDSECEPNLEDWTEYIWNDESYWIRNDDDIMFRSPEERYFAIELEKRNIPYLYEPQSYTLVKGANTHYASYRDTTYTPDFSFVWEDRKIIVEIKGYARGDNSLRQKLADIYFNEQGIEYYVIRLKGKKKDNTKGFYFYKDKTQSGNKSKRAVLSQLDRQFFTKIGIDTK